MEVDEQILESSSPFFLDNSQRSREKLLSGPSPLIITSYAGTEADYIHQCTAAKGMVSADRTRQLLEQAASGNRQYAIEFPAHALAAASPSFKQAFEADPNGIRIPLSLGRVLPGYAMCVLDWYCRALRSKTWYDFIPDDASIEGEDKWYWVYCYLVMRSLGMDEFAARLLAFIDGMLNDLNIGFESYAHLIRSLPDSDPLLERLAEYTAHHMLTQSLYITETECCAVAEHFPQFAQKVNEAMQWR
ncbi:hypothetical protein CC86DRAFT_408003 [Ophiobolus disseminans]|uniref:BTB domain-containing protein n=1 Tax=Ophiobolus disseminans TaxID=1469910 RepID=A0A6A6ZVJ3_9PLEO|nr:hypothetical protein CC86DRAFT_408003 [Ophiobolus disseminans]